jgi:hypothetical protein
MPKRRALSLMSRRTKAESPKPLGSATFYATYFSSAVISSPICFLPVRSAFSFFRNSKTS